MKTYLIEYAIYLPGEFTAKRSQDVVTATDSATARQIVAARFPYPVRFELINYREV